MKILTVYYPHGFKKFENFYVDYTFEKTSEGSLVVYEKDAITGEERLHAGFSNWDYFLIEEE